MNRLLNNINSLVKEFSNISKDRKEQLIILAEKIKLFKEANDTLNLVFVCTHNSRRSQLAEIWLSAACEFNNISYIKTHSAGTEVSNFNIRMVKALSRFGFELTIKEDKSNTVYEWHKPDFLNAKDNSKLFYSKTIDHPSLQLDKLICIMVCSHADENCPVITQSILRYPLRYEDPKKYDDTEKESFAYDSKVMEIGREMLLLAKYLTK